MTLDIYGAKIECRCVSSDLEERLIRPFVFFKQDAAIPEIIIEVKKEAAPYGSFPRLIASFSTPRNIVYSGKDIKIIDYFGKGVVVEQKGMKCYTIYGEDTNFLEEAFYLLVLSIFGQHCDKKRLLRMHALGLSCGHKAFVFLVPPGGGKSTLACAMLEKKGYNLISDDSPVFDFRTGAILPFPLRIGINDKNILEKIPKEFIYSIARMEFGLKHFIDCSYWSSQIEKNGLQNIILVSVKTILNGEPSMRKIAKINLLGPLLRDAIVGIGLYQGLEFIFGHRSGEILSRIVIVLKRTMFALRLVLACHTYKFIMTRNSLENARFLENYIKRLE